MPVILSPSLHEHNWYPPLKERLERAIARLGLDARGFHVVICPDPENQADLMVKQFTQDRLPIEVKKTRADVASPRTWKQARGYATNSTTAGLRHFCVTNGELLYVFRHEEGQRIGRCLVVNGRHDLGRFGSAGEADAVMDRWEEAITTLLRDLFVARQEYALDRSFDGLVEKYGEAHRLLADRLRRAVDAAAADPAWRGRFLAWCRTFSAAPEDPENHAVAGEEAAHLILHRILCYELFRAQLDLLEDDLKRKFGVPRVFLPPLTASAVGGAPIAAALTERFEALKRVNYEQVFERDPVLDSLPLDADAAEILRGFLEDVEAFPFDIESFEDARRVFPTIFESLVPPENRRRYGQVFTPPHLVQLLCRLCITGPDERVLDPAAGTGAFLEGAYERLSDLALAAGQTPDHRELLDRLYGVEISTFPLHLSAVRLALKHPALPTHARLHHADLFRTDPSAVLEGIREEVSSSSSSSNRPGESRMGTMGGDSAQGRALADVILGNPPYIRQEALAEKDAIRARIRAALREVAPSGQSYPYSPRDADAYFYFVEYATAFLREGGAAGWVLSDKFLVVDAGRHLKQFLLDHYHVRAVITLACRAFPENLVDTCLLVLRRATGGAAPDAPTAFLKIRRPLPPGEVVRLLEDPRPTSNAYRRLAVRRRAEMDAGEKWTRYLADDAAPGAVLAAPGVVPLVSVATYERGPDNGCAAFFFPGDELVESFDIPERFLAPAVERASDLRRLVLRVSECKRLLRVPPDTDLNDPENAGLRLYIEHAETPEFDAGYRHRGRYLPVPERPVVVANAPGGPWWSFLRGSGEWHILVPRGFRTHYKVAANRARAHASTNFWGLRLRGAGRGGRELALDIAFLAAFLNSTLGQLQVECEARRYAGFTKLERQELERLRVLDPQSVPLDARRRVYRLFLALDAAYSTEEYPGARERLDRALLALLGAEERYDDLADLLEELVAERREAGSAEGPDGSGAGS
ncbi:MAG: N-6 DNA methylase [Armatimonadetes bacterium]|nr:N-6 DNA methylase [Armatimonadota bacterium]